MTRSTILPLLLPVKFTADGLIDSFEESILCKSWTSSGGIEEKASLDKYVNVFIYCRKETQQSITSTIKQI